MPRGYSRRLGVTVVMRQHAVFLLMLAAACQAQDDVVTSDLSQDAAVDTGAPEPDVDDRDAPDTATGPPDVGPPSDSGPSDSTPDGLLPDGDVPTDATDDGTADATDDVPTDTAEPPPDLGGDPTDAGPSFVLAEVTASVSAPCAGATLSVTVRAAVGHGEVGVEMSGPNGDFSSPYTLGAVNLTGTQKTINVPLDPGLIGPGYRVRAIPEGSAEPVESAPFALHPHPIVAISDQRGVRLKQGEAHRVEALVELPELLDVPLSGQPVYEWALGDGATVTDENSAAPEVSWSTVGPKVMSVKVTSAAGCSASATLAAPLDAPWVMGCEVPMLTGTLSASGSASLVDQTMEAWVCGGGKLAVAGGYTIVAVEPGGSLAVTSGLAGDGVVVAYVKSGGVLDCGGYPVYVVAEPGAALKGCSPTPTLSCLALKFTSTLEDGCTSPDQPQLTLNLGDLPANLCPNGDLAVGVALSGEAGPKNTFLVQLSDASGTFADPTLIGALAGTAATSIPITLPGLTPGAQHRLRVITTDPPAISAPSAPLEVSTTSLVATMDVNVASVLVGEEVIFTNLTNDVEALAWTFTGDAVPSSVTETQVTAHWDSPGAQQVSVTITGADGCKDTLVVDAVRVFGCDVEVPADAVPFTEAAELSSLTSPSLLCGGVVASVANPEADVYLAPGASAAVYGAATGRLFVVPRWSGLVASELFEGIVLTEPGAGVLNTGAARVLECPALSVTGTQACPPYDATPPGLTVESPGVVCSGETRTVHFAREGVFAADASFRLELSDAQGAFGAPEVLGVVDNLESTEFTATFVRPTSSSYRLRVVSDAPAVVGESEPFTISAAPNITYVSNRTFYNTDQDFTFTAVGAGDATVVWDFGPDATPQTSTDIVATVEFSSPGVKRPLLTATTPAGCSSTFVADVSPSSVVIVPCPPPIPATASVITKTGGVLTDDTVVCPGVTFAASGGYRRIYVRAGGTFNFKGAGTYLVVLEGNAKLIGDNGGLLSAMRGVGAVVNILSQNMSFLYCPGTLTLDTSTLPPDACP